jgi:hypothetical protein
MWRVAECTVGDETTVPCPVCLADVTIQDITTDGCLKPGFDDFDCRKCGAALEIHAVDYSATVYVKVRGT